jgi:hypothetical protein
MLECFDVSVHDAFMFRARLFGGSIARWRKLDSTQ